MANDKDERGFFSKYKLIIAGIFMFAVILIGALSADDNVDVISIPDDADLIEISATELAKEYEEDQGEADANYKGELVEVKGIVSTVDISANQAYVILSTIEDPETKDVQCVFKDDAEIEKITDLNENDTVIIQGEVNGKPANVEVDKCLLKESS